MFGLCLNALRHQVSAVAKNVILFNIPRSVKKLQNVSNFSTLLQRIPSSAATSNVSSRLMVQSVLLNPKLGEIVSSNTQSRGLTKFSLRKGKKKTVKAVIKRFYRLHWGMWIRTKAGRHRKMWKKSLNNRRRLRQHVFTNSTQSWLLDKMVTNFWRKPKYWVNNPYEPYNTREEYIRTSMKPRDYWRDS